ncbi:DUF1624 domain-containing protein [Zunongwangia sp. SCSIO 43204]|uniref:DUF1624 domain-containing protein n=1 Tax=Zunongwangia sp. SCSIO 43204 TaxID=2779359 RepID=UPI001CA81A2B|nr:heparan-alpha-glucosaminide N-acetyltransferase domain-containing protein [Zunongwangia sp. SCSIO 43204]
MSHKIKSTSKRIHSIDILRGPVILLMIVDHVRERFFYHHQVTDPMDIQHTDPSLFFTRLSAHFCAPIFVFLTGLSAYLYQNPIQKPKRDLQSFLLKRGLFLIVLEITLINFSWFGNYQNLYLQVIWAIGLSMITLALVIKLPKNLIGGLGLVIIFVHNLLASINFQPNEIAFPLWTILHDRGYLLQSDILNIKVSYPVLPWIGVIFIGYYAGVLYTNTKFTKIRHRYLLASAFTSLTILGLLRGFNLYGETNHWQIHSSPIESIMSFINFTKYPPSLDFLLLTLGIGCFLLYFIERFEQPWMLVLKTFGSVPMFIYVCHLYILLIAYQILTQH